MDVVALRTLCWVGSSGLVAGGRPAQEKKVNTKTKCSVRHFHFFVPIMLLINRLPHYVQGSGFKVQSSDAQGLKVQGSGFNFSHMKLN